MEYEADAMRIFSARRAKLSKFVVESRPGLRIFFSCRFGISMDKKPPQLLLRVAKDETQATPADSSFSATTSLRLGLNNLRRALELQRLFLMEYPAF